MRKTNKALAILLTFCMLSTLVQGIVFAAPMEIIPLSEAALDEYQPSRDYTLDEIRAMLQQGDALLHGFERVYRPYYGPVTYEIPTEELMGIFGAPMTADEMQATNANFTYAVRPIIGEGRPCEDSIVLVLLGDGFTVGNGLGQVGFYQNPGAGTFLRSAHDFAETLMAMYPFSLFRDIFKIYAVETPSAISGIREGTEQAPVTAPYPGTYLGTFLRHPWNVTSNRVPHILNISNWVSPNAIMTQVLANTTTGAGVAIGIGAGYQNLNTVGISTRFTGWPNIVPGWHGAAYHSIVVHEIGHNFGRLTDEHSTGSTLLGRANVARASDTDAELKWGHWLGHAGIIRRTVNAPPGFIFPSVDDTCKMQGWRATFCAVCRAELNRRMAMISGETFEAGRRPDGTFRPETPDVTVLSQHNRILPYAFHGNTSLQTVSIPESVIEIGDFAFIGATGLRTIVNYSTIPQQINETTFAGVIRENVTVTIPSGTTGAYLAAGWRGFNLVERVLAPVRVGSLATAAPMPANMIYLCLITETIRATAIEYDMLVSNPATVTAFRAVRAGRTAPANWRWTAVRPNRNFNAANLPRIINAGFTALQVHIGVLPAGGLAADIDVEGNAYIHVFTHVSPRPRGALTDVNPANNRATARRLAVTYHIPVSEQDQTNMLWGGNNGEHGNWAVTNRLSDRTITRVTDEHLATLLFSSVTSLPTQAAVAAGAREGRPITLRDAFITMNQGLTNVRVRENNARTEVAEVPAWTVYANADTFFNVRPTVADAGGRYRPARVRYFVRSASRIAGTAEEPEFVPMSRPARLQVSSALAPPSAPRLTGEGTTTLRRGWMVVSGNAVTTAEPPVVIVPFAALTADTAITRTAGDDLPVRFRIAPTARHPASMAQTAIDGLSE